jgi:hypothetical protein
MLVYFIYIWSILRPFGIFYGHSLYFVVILSIFPSFGILHQELSGNPDVQGFEAVACPLFIRRTEYANACVSAAKKCVSVATQASKHSQDNLKFDSSGHKFHDRAKPMYVKKQ